MKRNKIFPALFAASLFLGGCSAEMPIVEEEQTQNNAEPLIEIVGGKPSGLALDSRATDSDNTEPARPGVCNADRLQLWVYRGIGTSGAAPDESKLTEIKKYGILDGLRFSGKNYNDKVITESYTAQREIDKRVGYVVPALAYSENEKSLFTYNDTEKIHTSLSVELSENNRTPELYFGGLKFKSDETGTDSVTINNLKGYLPMSVVRGKNSTNKANPVCYIFGKLYRIVSQINIDISDIDVNNIESIELLVSNLPTSIKLYGDHGLYYPIEAAKEAERHTGFIPNDDDDLNSDGVYVSIDKTSDFTRKTTLVTNDEGKKIETYTYTAHLSSFILPSEIGRQVKIRVTYFPGTVTDKDGNPLADQSKIFDVRPTKDYKLVDKEEDVHKKCVYKIGSKGKVGDPVTIYDHTNDLFFSVANVRVNLKGKFNSVCSDFESVDAQIEVCSSFEASHHFNF